MEGGELGGGERGGEDGVVWCGGDTGGCHGYICCIRSGSYLDEISSFISLDGTTTAVVPHLAIFT